MTNTMQVFTTPELMLQGISFPTKSALTDYLRKPLVREAMVKVAGNREDIADFLIAKEVQISEAFDTGTIRHVKKSEKKALELALDHLQLYSSDPKLAFLLEHRGEVLESFKFSQTKRMTPEEKELVTRNTILSICEADQALADWILTNRDGIMLAFEAGKVKREVTPQAAAGLAAYREKMAAAKAAKEAETAAKEVEVQPDFGDNPID